MSSIVSSRSFIVYMDDLGLLYLKLYDQANAMDAESKDLLLNLSSTQTNLIDEGS